VQPRFARQEKVRPVAALSTTEFSSHSTVTAVIDMTIAILENEDRIGSALDAPDRAGSDHFDAKSIVL